VNEPAGSIDYFNTIKSGLIEPGTFNKDNNIFIIGGGNARAYNNTTNIFLENEILKVTMPLLGTSTTFVSINTSSAISSIQIKSTNETIIPVDTSIIIENVTNSSWGIGYSQIVKRQENLPEAQALFHVQSNLSSAVYDVVYSLPARADFLIIDVKNVTNNQTTMNYIYHIGLTTNNDIVNISNGTNGKVASLANICWNASNLISDYACSYDNTSDFLPINTSGLVGYWRFEEGSGTTASDSSGYQHTGTINSANFETGLFGNAYNSTSNSSYISIANSGDLPSWDISISAWINPRYQSNTWPTIYNRGNQNGAIGYNWIYFTRNNTHLVSLTFQYANGTVQGPYATVNIPYNSQWTYIAVTYNNASGLITFYKNGISVGTSNVVGFLPVTSVTAYLGIYQGYTTGSYNFNGTIDEVQIWNRSLTASEISQLYNQQLSSRFSGLIFAGDSTNFVQTCYQNYTATNYKLNISFNNDGRVIIPFSKGECSSLENKMRIISKQNVPSTAFNTTYSLGSGGDLPFGLILEYNRIKIQGSDHFGSGLQKVCIQKTGEVRYQAVVNVSKC